MKNQESFYDTMYSINHKDNYGGSKKNEKWKERIHKLKMEALEWLNETNLNKKEDAIILEIGCGMGYLHDIHPGYKGIEYSKEAVERFQQVNNILGKVIKGDAQNLNIEDNSVDGVMTFAALEHVYNPNKALLEIDRILKKGGCGLISPAWHCRGYTVKKLRLRNYKDLSLSEKIEKFFIPISDSLIFRFLVALPQRLAAEIKWVFNRKEKSNLLFQELKPQYDLIEKYGHVTDDDAVASISKHSAILFFLTRGYKVVGYDSFIKRILVRGGTLKIIKS